MTAPESSFAHSARPQSTMDLIGGEMPAWSDAPAGGPLLRWLAAAAAAAAPPGGRVLVAGPHEAELVESLAAGRTAATCLLRSYADAVALARRCPGVRVLCGSLAKLGPDERFDAIVALDGLPRLTSAEGPQLSWGESLDALAGALRPGGRLLLALENLLGIHELVAFAPWYADDGDAGWTPAGECDGSRPRSLERLVARLDASGLRAGLAYCGYPLPGAPRVLVAADADMEPLGAVVGAACGDGFAGTPVLTDPRRLAVSALGAGLGASLAPLWIVVAGREPAPLPLDLPHAVVADAATPPGWGVGYEISPAGERRPLVIGEPDPEDGGRAWPAPWEAGRVRRDPRRLAGPVPQGRSLEELAIGACLRRDVPGLRRLLGGYAGWLAGHRGADGRLPGEHAFGTLRTTVVRGPRFAALDPSWALTGPAPYEVALARGLRQLAGALIAGGYSHPWPETVDPDGLTVILAGLAGQTVTRDTVREAAALDAEIVAAVRGPGAAVPEEATAPAVDLDGHRELRRSVQRLTRQLDHATAQLAWYAELLDSRERALARARRTVAVVTGSVVFRVLRALARPARGARRLIRRQRCESSV